MRGSGIQFRRLTPFRRLTFRRLTFRRLTFKRPAWPTRGPLAHAVRLRRTLTLARRSVNEFRDDHCTQLAAAISFHLLFSVFPLAIVAVAVIGMVTSNQNAHTAVMDALLKVVPLSKQGEIDLGKVLSSISGNASALGLLGLLGMIWSASGVMAAIRTALNIAWDTDVKRPFVRGKLVDLALIAGTVLVTGATLALSVAAGIARQRAAQLPEALRGLTPLAGVVVSAAVFVASVALLFSTFALLYRLVPAVPTRLRGIWPGALTAAVGFTVLQYGFSVYIAHFANYNKVYGALGAAIAFLVFVYIASMVFLFGAEVASEYPRLTAGQAADGNGVASSSDNDNNGDRSSSGGNSGNSSDDSSSDSSSDNGDRSGDGSGDNVDSDNVDSDSSSGNVSGQPSA